MIIFVNKIIIGLPTIFIPINAAGRPNIAAEGNPTNILIKLIENLFLYIGPSEIFTDFDKHLRPLTLR